MFVVTYVSEFVVIALIVPRNELSALNRVVVSSDETLTRLRLASVPTLRVVTFARGVERIPVLTVKAWSESTFAPSATLRPNVPVLVV